MWWLGIKSFSNTKRYLSNNLGNSLEPGIITSSRLVIAHELPYDCDSVNIDAKNKK